MIPQNELNLFKDYVTNTPARLQSTKGWTGYLRANSGPTGAYDAALRRNKLVSFEQMYGVRLGPRGETIALDQHGDPPPPRMHLDADPPPQHLVETDAEPPIDEHEIRGRAPPWGPSDLPARRSVTEPNPNIATDPPVSEAQRRAMGAAASGHSRLGIPQSVGEKFLHEDAALGEIETGQQGREVGPEDWERTRGRDQAEHEDHEQDEAMIARVLNRLGFSAPDVEKAIARDRKRRAADRARKAKDQGPEPFEGMPQGFKGVEGARLVGEGRRFGSDSASFVRMYPHAAELTQGQPAITPRVFIDRRNSRTR
jgi:hypothetical protein